MPSFRCVVVAVLFTPTKAASLLQPTLRDFQNFHAMHIGVAAAQRCVQSFQGGTIIFAPSSYRRNMDTSFPKTGLSRFEVGQLTTLKYYLLVLGTLTGCSTILGLTDVVQATDSCHPRDAAPLVHPLHPREPVLEYLERRCGTKVSLARRFEYRFRLVGLHVVMLHYRSLDGQLHLVEIYEAAHRLLMLVPVMAFLMIAALAVGFLP
jgi:hypothetical protein